MNKNLFKTALLAFFIVIAFITLWEIYLRSKGVNIAYDDGKELWSHHRASVYQSKENATVFIGSSRIKYALDIATWKELTNGNKPIQLAIEGNSPLPVLEDLAADENFQGNLVVDVTEGLFFSSSPFSLEFPREHVEYYKERSPSEKVSFQIKSGLESQFVFLDRDNFTIDNIISNSIKTTNRKGVFAIPNQWPIEFGRINFDRQNIMMDRFLRDTTLQKLVTGNWLFFASIDTEKPAEGKKLDSFFTVIKQSVDKIKSRGGDVIFVRTPSSGPYWEEENTFFVREKYWDALLKFTNCQGIHFKDYKETDHFICPEWSHLSPKDAITYTKHFVQTLREKGWSLNQTQTISYHH